MQDQIVPIDIVRDAAKKLYIPALPYHNFDHALRVLEEAKTIIARCRNEEVQVHGLATMYAALFHDAGYGIAHRVLGYPSKEALAADWMARALQVLRVNGEIISLAQGTVLGTAHDASFPTNEAKVLRAADLAELSKDLATFIRNNRLLKLEWELLSGSSFKWAEWKLQTKAIVELYLSQDIRLTSYHDDEQGNSRFHVQAQQILDEYLTLPDSELE